MSSCWVEVNLDAIRHNFRAVQELVGEATTVIAVVKANAYGHGAVEVSRALVSAGARFLAVTRLEEALPLREAGIQTPILLLAPALPDEAEDVVAHRLTASVASADEARRLSLAAARQGVTARVHLKVNTGMGRLGVEPGEAVEVATRLVQLDNLELEGMFTHFATAAERNPTLMDEQYGKFVPLMAHLGRVAGVPVNGFHCANSAALLRFPAMRLSCVRPGTILYGQFPSPVVAEVAAPHLKLRDGFRVKARIIALKSLQPGQTLGYGAEWKASQPSRIATVAVGYADGLTQEPQARSDQRELLRRSLGQAAKSAAQWAGLKKGGVARTVLIKGQRAPIIGRIAMQQCSIDVTHLKDVAVGDEVIVSMRRISAGAHLPRVYTDDKSEA